MGLGCLGCNDAEWIRGRSFEVVLTYLGRKWMEDWKGGLRRKFRNGDLFGSSALFVNLRKYII